MHVTKGDIDSVKQLILDMHDRIIEASGGEKGVRDEGGLEHAIEQLDEPLWRADTPEYLNRVSVYVM